jgi:hypothetical protein
MEVIYWKPFYYLLEDAGFEVMPVNARQVKNLPGRESDVSDAPWLAQLGAHGLVRGSLVPPAPIRESPRRLQALSLVNGAFPPSRRLHRTVSRPAEPPWCLRAAGPRPTNCGRSCARTGHRHGSCGVPQYSLDHFRISARGQPHTEAVVWRRS